MENEKISVLYVDDERNNLISFKATFRIKYNVFIATGGEEAMAILKDNVIHVIITDQRMPNMTGVEFLEKVLQEEHKAPIRVLLTGYTDMSAIIDAVNKGRIFHYLTKPWNEDELSETIERAYQIYVEREKIKILNQKLTLSNEQLEFMIRQKLLS